MYFPNIKKGMYDSKHIILYRNLILCLVSFQKMNLNHAVKLNIKMEQG